jgi:hypothetical protein
VASFTPKALTLNEIIDAKLLGKQYTISNCEINEVITFTDKK